MGAWCDIQDLVEARCVGDGLQRIVVVDDQSNNNTDKSQISLDYRHNERNLVQLSHRYIDNFSVVITAYEKEQYTALRISQMIRLSEKLAKEYIDLYHQFKDNSDCQYRLEQIALRADNLFDRCKKNRGMDQ